MYHEKYNGTSNKKPISRYEIDYVKLWSRVNRGGKDSCWEWTGGRNTGGYGLMSVNSLPEDYERTGRTKTQVLVHRAVAYQVYGDLAVDKYVCHSCDKPLCCNPDHIWVGSQYENVHDMLTKGRANFKWRKYGASGLMG